MLRKNTMTRWTTTAILVAGVGLLASEVHAQVKIVPADGFTSGPIGHTNQGTLADPVHSNQGGGGGDPPDPDEEPLELGYSPDGPVGIGVGGMPMGDPADLWTRLPIERDALVRPTAPGFDSLDNRSAPVAVPEPSSLMLIAVGLGCLVRRRR